MKAVTKAVTKIIEFSKRLYSARPQLVLSIAAVCVGILGCVLLVISRNPPKRVEPDILAPLVKVRRLNVENIQMVVAGYGTVKPSVQVEITPQVSGKIISVNPKFKTGGFIAANQQLLQIDPRDYELSVRQAEAIVAEAQVQLDLEQAEAAVARNEWRDLHGDKQPASALVFRDPQIRQAQARLKSAKAQLAETRLNLERTSLSLPIDARIISKKVDLGQYVMTGQSLGVAYGVESVEIELPLEDEELAWFDIPDEQVSANGKAASKMKTLAAVNADFAGANHTWVGYVTRTTGQVDTTSRLVSVVVEVPKPFDTGAQKPALLPGTFVEILIAGKTIENAIAVPRTILHSGNQVWVVNDGRLHVQTVEILRTDKDFAYTTSGIEDGALVVFSSLDFVVEAMKVRVQLDETTQNSREVK